jgi:hypothetical protein
MKGMPNYLTSWEVKRQRCSLNLQITFSDGHLIRSYKHLKFY